MRYLLICLLFCTIVPAQGQIHNPSQIFIEAGAGLMDGIQIGMKDNAARWFKVGFGKYGKNEGIWQGALLVQDKYFDVESVGIIQVNQYLIDGSFTPKFIRTFDKKFYISPTLGVLLGYEQTNDKILFPNNAKKLSRWIVGCSGGLSGELNLSSTVALVASTRGIILPSSKIQAFHFQYGLSIRVNFFKQ